LSCREREMRDRGENKFGMKETGTIEEDGEGEKV
jgi:hypothetical protein